MDKVRVSVVSYLNSQPFIYGLEQKLENDIVLSKDIPSNCAQKVIHGEVDLGLIPVAALSDITNGHIISDYCLAADGPVNSVFLFSHKPLNEIRTIRLDKQSITSNNLCKILIMKYWKINVYFVNTYEEADAEIIIGDRTFNKINKYPFVFDLSEQWKKYTGLPFVFAVWAANKQLPESFIEKFNAALKWGLNNREELLKQLPKIEGFDAHDYLFKKISYVFDDTKRKAMNLFLTEINNLEQQLSNSK